MSRSAAAAVRRSGSPPVLVWDSKTESFTPRVPDPHSSISSIHCVAPSSPTASITTQSSSNAVNYNVTPQHPFPPSSASPPSSPLGTSHPNDSSTGTIGTKKTRRMRHHSNPESIVDFGEFLKQIDRERTVSAGAGQAENVAFDAPSSSDKPLPPQPPAPVSSNSKPSAKNPLKYVLKEVLGGGGNNQNLVLPKDSVVPSFGRGGIARTNTKSSKSSKETKATKKDPYYAHVSYGSPPSPTQMYFPPNSNLPFPRAKAAVDPWEPVSLQADISYYAIPRKPRGAVHDAAEQAGKARATAVSPAPTASSVSTLSSDAPHDRPGKAGEGAMQPALKISTTVDQNKPPRRRSKSFTSPVSAGLPTPPPKSGLSIGVFLHPAQVALEAKLKQQAEEAKDKFKDGVRVVVQPVDDQSARDVDVISMADTELDDAISLSGFPLPPSTPISARDRLFSLPVTPIAVVPEATPRQHSTSGGLQPPSRVMGPRPQTRNRLPTMPAPSQAYRQPQLTLPSSEISSWMPPPPSRPPPLPVKIPSTPVSPARSKPLGPPPSIPLPPIPPSSSPPIFGSAPSMPRRGSLPDRAASSPPSSLPKSYGQSFPDQYIHRPHRTPQPSQQPWLPPIRTDVHDMAGVVVSEPSPASDHVYLQQLALERERQELEVRVRGLMWLVTSLEQESQSGHGEEERVDRALTPRGLSAGLRTPSPATTDKRSSTSTERAVTYLPYAR
ncbi:hypothetical protein FRB90_011384 [Tulasnella sp. 427]|nr:hypothetical protein FRB90_011384 [Tulasnella sp. 427]